MKFALHSPLSFPFLIDEECSAGPAYFVVRVSGMASGCRWPRQFRCSGARYLLGPAGAINIAPLCAATEDGSPESRHPQHATPAQRRTLGMTPVRRRGLELSFHISRFTDGSDTQATASRPRSIASDGRSLASRSRSLGSDGRSLTSLGRSLASDGRALASRGRSIAARGRSLTLHAPAMAADVCATPAHSRALTAQGHAIAVDG